MCQPNQLMKMLNIQPNRVRMEDELFKVLEETQSSNSSNESSSPFYVKEIRELQSLAEGGNEVAERYADAFKRLASLQKIFQTENSTSIKTNVALQSRILFDTAFIIKSNCNLPPWSPTMRETLTEISDVAFKRQNCQTPWPFVHLQLDKAIRICHIYFLTNKSPLLAYDLAIKTRTKYPSEPFFCAIRSSMLAPIGKIDEALQSIYFCLEIFPTHLGLLNNKATLLKYVSTIPFEEHLDAWHAFLHHASKSERSVPKCHYEIGLLIANRYLPEVQTCRDFTRALNKMKKALDGGEDSEKHILPCNLKDRVDILPLKCDLKNAILEAEEKIAEMKAKGEIIQRKVSNHRNLLYPDNKASVTSSRSRSPEYANFEEMLADMMVKSLELKSPKFIKFTSIEPAFISICQSTKKPMLTLLLQQGNFGPVFECQIVNFNHEKFDQQQKDIKELFGIGCKISLAKPEPKDGFIRIDDPSPDSLLIHVEERVQYPCSYCGVQDAPVRCAKCNVACFCDKHCQMRDWKAFEHKKFCLKIKL